MFKNGTWHDQKWHENTTNELDLPQVGTWPHVFADNDLFSVQVIAINEATQTFTGKWFEVGGSGVSEFTKQQLVVWEYEADGSPKLAN